MKAKVITPENSVVEQDLNFSVGNFKLGIPLKTIICGNCAVEYVFLVMRKNNEGYLQIFQPWFCPVCGYEYPKPLWADLMEVNRSGLSSEDKLKKQNELLAKV